MLVNRDKIWLVVAAYNEGRVIRDVVSEIVAHGWNVVIVDDGSTDDTAAKAKMPGSVVLQHTVNLGQGAALQTGFAFALQEHADAVVTFDADGQHSIDDVPELIAALPLADVALGSRFLGKEVVGATKGRRALLGMATKVSNRLSGLKLTDAHCGLRAIRASALPALEIHQDRMAHASEMLRNIHTAGLRVAEVPVTVKYTEHSMAKGQTWAQSVRILFDYFIRTS